MEKPTSTRTKRHSTFVGVLLGSVYKLILLSFLAWILLLLALSIIVIQRGKEAANVRSHLLLNSEIEFITSKNLSIAHDFLVQSTQFRSKIEKNVNCFLDSIALFSQKINQHAQNIVLKNTPIVTTIITMILETLEIIIDRLFTFILSLPLLFSVLFVMIVDGLGQRDIRKFQAARESTFLFHRLKILTTHVFYGFFLIFMSVPWAIEPQVLLLPMVLIVSVLFMLTIKHYKKYL